MRTLLTITLVATTLGNAAWAREVTVYNTTDVAKVIAVDVIPGPDTTRQVCHPVTADKPAAHSTLGAIAGGLGGALIGSRFGSGHGKDALTVAGAVGGAIAGDRVGANMAGNDAQQNQTCETVTERGQPAGYKVTFEHKGRRQTVTMDHDPGNTVQVHTDVSVE
jgi:uncharacterized protein YcfJ